MRIPKPFFALIAAGALLFTTQTADAALTLRLTEGGTTVTVVDGGAGDANPVAGAVTFIGVVGVFIINVSTGLGDPVLPNTAQLASIDLNSVNTSTVPGTLEIALSDVGFTLESASEWSGLLDLGGTTGGSITVQFYLGLDDQLFSQDVLIADLGPFEPGAFSGSDGESGSHDLSQGFSLTLVATITHGSGVNITSFDADAKVTVPTPGTLPLFLAGLVALGFRVYSTRRRRDRRLT